MDSTFTKRQGELEERSVSHYRPESNMEDVYEEEGQGGEAVCGMY